MRKKFLLILGIVVLCMVLVAIVWTWMLYEEVSASGRTIRWRHITQPFALPLIVLGIYAVFVSLWLVIKLKAAQGAMLTGALDIMHPLNVQLGSGERTLGEVEYSDRRSGESILTMNGRLIITNQRVVHSPVASSKRIGTLFGMNEPDVIFSLVHNHIRQCGFGLDPKDASRFVVVEMDGTMHSFYASSRAAIEYAIRGLGWKETRAGEMLYWIR